MRNGFARKAPETEYGRPVPVWLLIFSAPGELRILLSTTTVGELSRAGSLPPSSIVL